jgi:riboflavin synthase
MTRKTLKKINALETKLAQLIEEKAIVCDQVVSLGAITEENSTEYQALESKFYGICDEIKDTENEISIASRSKSNVDSRTMELVNSNID